MGLKKLVCTGLLYITLLGAAISPSFGQTNNQEIANQKPKGEMVFARKYIGNFQTDTWTAGADVAAGDFDGDGNLDFIVANTTSKGNTSSVKVQSFTNSGNGYFHKGYVDEIETDNSQLSAHLGLVHGVAVEAADLNNDGFYELILAYSRAGNSNANNLIVFKNNKRHLVQHYTDKINTPAWNSRIDLTIGDLNRDGNMDLAAGYSKSGNSREHNLIVFRNKRGYLVHHYTDEINTPAWNSGFGLETMDYNGDTKTDLVAIYAKDAGSQKNNIIFFQNSKGYVSRSNSDSFRNESRNSSVDIASGDFDLDGDIDFVIAHTMSARSNYDNLVMYINNGSGQFTTKRIGSFRTDAWNVGMGIDAGDFDNDGDLDIVVAHSIRYGSKQSNLILFENNIINKLSL
ncbi:FG-GAP repeat domain-containing protein [Bacteroidota bacterium]